MISKQSADYRAATGQKRCGNCSMYRTGGKCTLVRGLIKPSDTCKYWEAKKK